MNHPPDGPDRCQSYQHTVGRCQLIDAHRGRHAIAVDGAFVTWYRSTPQRWAKQNPPVWLPKLPWVVGDIDPGRRQPPGTIAS